MRANSQTRQKDITVGGITLSPRQMDVLKMTAAGMSATIIAQRLGISVSQAKAHRKVIRQKFNLPAQPRANNAELLVNRAKQIGFL